MENIKIKSLGPIAEADINFGDLTFFVGPQASGKSVVLQLIKLLVDRTEIEKMLEERGFVWRQDSRNNLDLFFGEGMAGLWTKRTDVLFDGINYAKDFLSSTQGYPQQQLISERVLYIPAQRVLCLSNGWPRFFNDFDESAPFVLREFSEFLRLYLDSASASDSDLFFATAANDIYWGGTIMIDRQKRKRIMLEFDDVKLPVMAWSSGQKEFFPLAMSFEILAPFPPRGLSQIDCIIIEEPEMGLHPDAIKTVILQIVDLMKRGYKVIISTHSPVLLEFAWAFNILKQEKASPENFDELFDISKNTTGPMFFTKELIDKTINTYYFDRADSKVIVRDISTLDASNDDPSVSEWGGLSSFASKAGDIVSNAVANAK